MMIACFTPLNLLILMVAQNCMTITDCADSGRKRDKNVYTSPSTSGAKKSMNVGEAASTSGAAAEAGSSNRQKYNWTRELDNEILTIYYGGKYNDSSDWNSIYEFLSAKHPNIPPSGVTRDRIYTILRKLTRSTPRNGEGTALWTPNMKADVIGIYFKTRVADENEHAMKMYNMWKYRRHPDISPIDLLHQAENMLMRHDILEPRSALPEDRKKKIMADKNLKLDPQLKDIFRKMCDKLPLDEPLKVETFYDELCKNDPRFSVLSPQKLSKKAWTLLRHRKMQHQESQAPDVTEEENHFLGQSRQEEHHQFHEFMSVQDNPLVHSQSAYHHAQGIGVSSSHQRTTYEYPDLDLSLGSGAVGTPQIHHPDVDLDLSLSSRKKKGKSIWERGSS